LQYFGKRYYAPLLNRWVSADPLAVHVPGEADLASAPSAEIFDPAASGNPWSLTGAQVATRSGPAAVRLPDGRVLLSGGDGSPLPAKSAEIYDKATNKWSSAGNMSVNRTRPASALFGGKVLVVGGAFSTVDVFDPATSSWSLGPEGPYAMGSGRFVSLSNGDWFGYTEGSSSYAELYDSVAQKFWVVQNHVFQSSTAAAPLADGRALVSGGGLNFTFSAEAFIFDPKAPEAYLGGLCTSASECKGGFCEGHVCCNAACGKCLSCNQADTGQPSGNCAPVQAGKDPNNACKDDGSPSCNDNGLCDGAGACQKYPAGSSCAPQACSSGSQCTSGVCSDGICCNVACSGTCKACTAALKGQGADGICDFVKDGSDPESECGTIGSATCAGNGVCDGAGVCRSPLAGTVCGPSSCIGVDAQNNASTCSAAGTCTNNGTSACAPYLCSVAACLTACTSDANCAQGYKCAGGKCVQPKGNGLACAAGPECESGFCVAGLCCDSLCDGTCEACAASEKASGSSGVCGPRKAGATCGASSCKDGASATVNACDGSGACVAKEQPCAPYLCANDACQTTCATSADCAATFDCVSSACVSSTSDSGAGGAAGSSGSGGTSSAGATGTGGAGTGGAGTGGAGTGGAGTGGAGTGGAGAGGKKQANDAKDDGGCGCRLPHSSPSDGPWAALPLLGLLASRLGRRRERPRSRLGER